MNFSCRDGPTHQDQRKHNFLNANQAQPRDACTSEGKDGGTLFETQFGGREHKPVYTCGVIFSRRVTIRDRGE